MSDTIPANSGFSAAERGEALKMLEQHHCFPGSYMFKVIGYNSGDFAQETRRAAEAVLGPLIEAGAVRSRPSAGGKYLAVTIEAELASAEQVLEVYQGLRALEGLVTLA